MSKVALVYCEAYELNQVREAVKQGLDLLGGAAQFVQPGEKILIKPNLLAGDPPEKCVSPHPMVFQAVLEEFKNCGVQLSYGDSPGYGNPAAAARGAGLSAVAQALDVPMADFQNGQIVSFHEGNLIKQFTLAKGVLEADGLISLCKMKANALTRLTGAIKNQFGCVPGVLKAEFHSKLPSANIFSKMLVDLNLLVKPRLFIMDGVMAMEGNGPRNGNPRPMHVLLFSDDPVALDATVCKMVDIDENLIEPIMFGNEFGLGSSENIEIVGEPVHRFINPDFVVNRSRASTTADYHILTSKLMRNHVAPRPVINDELCTKCGHCVKICPADPKALSWKSGKDQSPMYEYSQCIRCYCCQGMCPHEAISVEVPLLGRLVHRQHA